MRTRSLVLALTLPLFTLGAQGHKQLTTADYDRAVKMLGQNVNALVVGGQVNATWTPDGKFWYRSVRPEGNTFLLVDPAKKKSAPLFDHAKVAEGLAKASGGSFTASTLPFMGTDVSAKRDTAFFTTAAKRYACELKTYTCKQTGDAPALTGMPAFAGRRGGGRGMEVMSPDG